MHRHKVILKKTLLFIALLVLFLPLLQSWPGLVPLYKLAGDEGPKKDTSLTFSTFFSGIYQQKLNDHLASDFGFRSLLIKLNNQVNFSLFHKVNARGVIAGKDNYLFETTYIHAQMGKDFIGEDSIHNRLKRLKLISDRLLALNKHLILVIAPSKPSYYKEFLPDEYLPGSAKNNYSVVSKSIQEQQLSCIDFSAYFNTIKSTSPYPLYPKHGNHWSAYGAYLAADSIIKFIEWQRKSSMPVISIKRITTGQPKNDDKDIEYGINLLFRLKSFDLAYPEIACDTINKTKPNVLVIGDSFYWNLYHLGINRCFAKSQFWYYNQAVYPVNTSKQLMVNELDVNKELDQYDVIIILATESNIHNLGWGFIEQAKNYLNSQVIN